MRPEKERGKKKNENGAYRELMFLVMRKDDICSAGISGKQFMSLSNKAKLGCLGREQDGLLFLLTAYLQRISEDADDSVFTERHRRCLHV